MSSNEITYTDRGYATCCGRSRALIEAGSDLSGHGPTCWRHSVDECACDQSETLEGDVVQLRNTLDAIEDALDVLDNDLADASLTLAAIRAAIEAADIRDPEPTPPAAAALPVKDNAQEVDVACPAAAERIEHVMGAVHPSVPPEMVAQYLLTGAVVPLGPREIGKKLLDVAMIAACRYAGKTMADLRTTDVEAWRAHAGYQPEGYWTGADGRAHRHELIAATVKANAEGGDSGDNISSYLLTHRAL